MAVYSQYELVKAMGQPGCPVCRLIRVEVRRFLDGLLYESSVDPASQHKFRASRGICNVHSQLLRETRGYSVPIATLYEAAIDELMQMTREGCKGFSLRKRGDGRQLSERLKPKRRCPCCVVTEEAEKLFAETFAEGLADPGFLQAFKNSQGLCLLHFRRLLEQNMPQQSAAQLLETQREIWGRLLVELDLFMARSGERGDGQPVGEEGTSWTRAVDTLGGLPGIFGNDYEA
ncbi:MAG: hypothetical protein IAE89_10045 [Anaerolineae bacterium]|nr:hypothetical protein [Anaerolineae bacterium]